MQTRTHQNTSSKSHNLYSFKDLADRGRILSVIFEAIAFAGLVAALAVLLWATP